MIFLSFFLFSNMVFADNEWGSGGGPGVAGPGGDDSGNTNFDCYTIARCPRWIKVTQDTYRQLVDEDGTVLRAAPAGSYTMPKCLTDEYIVIAGNQRKDGSLQIRNFWPKSNINPNKMTYQYTSEATSINKDDITQHVDWDATEASTFMGQTVPGKDYTFGDLLRTVVEESGLDVQEIAAFCSSMISPTYFSSSKVSVDGTVVADTGIAKEQTTKESSVLYKRTDGTSISFSHDIFADGEEEGVSWSVGKSFKKNGSNISFSGGTGGTTSGTADITEPFSGHDEATFISTTSPQYEDTYQKDLSLAANYTLCESMAVDDTSDYLSKACAKINVPYNFINTASISLGNINIFAGEKINISVDGKVNVNKRTNNTVGGTYATRVDRAKIKVVSYLSSTDDSSMSAREISGDSICVTGRTCDDIINKTNQTLNATGDVNGEEIGLPSLLGSNASVNIYDAPAGTFYCVAVAVYPASSGTDTMMNASGSNTWYLSKPSCKRIAKKPSIQVWGSGLFTAGKITVYNAVKHVVKDKLNDYNATNRRNVVFGSWVEQNIVANGLISMASGAADGLAGGTNRTKSGLNGSYTDSGDQICILSPLTMPNNKCGAMNPGGTSGSMNAPVDREALVARFTNEDDSESYELHDGVCTISGVPSFDTVKTNIYKC